MLRSMSKLACILAFHGRGGVACNSSIWETKARGLLPM